MTEIKKGQKVYNRNGEIGLYEGLLNGSHYVRAKVVTYDYEGDEHLEWGDPEVWYDAYLKPPTKVLEEEVAKLKAQISVHKDELAKAKKANSEERANHSAVMKELDEKAYRYPGLRRLIDFLDGKITHIVMAGYQGYIIKPISEIMHETNNWPKKTVLPMCSVFGLASGDLLYGTDKWQDISSDNPWKTAFKIAYSEEDAIKVRQQWVADNIAEHVGFLALDQWQTQLDRVYGFLRDDESMALKYDVPFPDLPGFVDYKKRMLQKELETTEKNLAQQESNIAIIKKRLDELRASQ